MCICIKKIKSVFKRKNEKINGTGNVVNIDKKINYSIKVDGNNNFVDITSKVTVEPQNLRINIKGNNNKIIIKDLRTANNLNIDMGNFIGVDNAEIEILDNFACVQVNILAFQSDTPIKIGANCLFSKGVCIRTGERPHAIYDMNTLENLDKSDGVYIGNHVWIGENVFIMKRGKISDNSIVGAMSVVTKKFDEEHVVIAGNPAKICKRNVMWDESVNNVPK